MLKRRQEIRLFFGELRRRRVVRVAIAYAFGAWVTIEASSVILPAFAFPNWALQLVIVVCALGFPFALVLSWIFDLTPTGLVRTDEVDARAVSSPNGVTSEPDAAGDLESVPEDAAQPRSDGFAERRQITVLRYTLRCRDENDLQLDPEVLRDILPETQRYCAGIVDRYNGHMAWSHQDEGEAYFGYPKALEHDARSAVRCAIELRDQIGATGNPGENTQSVQTQLSAAIHTGLAVTESDQGPGDRGPLTGEFSRTVARLLDLAPPGEIVIGSPTHALVHDFYDLTNHEKLRSGQSSDATYLVGQERESLIYRSAYALAAGKLLGRDHEIALLEDRWERAVAGTGQTVSLVGEPGIGKSALVGAIIEHCARQHDAVIAECCCTPFNQNVALYPVSRLFRRSLLGLADRDSTSDHLTSIEAFFAERELPLEENVPLLARFLAVPFETRYAPLELSPEQLKDRTLELIIHVLMRRAELQPVLLVMEDLHWSDATTLDLIGRIIDHGPEARLLTLLTYRPELDPPWSARTDVTGVSLGNLTRPQAAELVGLAAGDTQLPMVMRERIVAHSDGIPLFLEELTKAVVETASQSTSLDHTDIPSTLQDTLMARLDRLGRAKRVAQMAAVFGREFSFEWIEALTAEDYETLGEDLDILVAAGLAYQRGTRPQCLYIFKHALIQEAASLSLLRRDRRQIHQRIATLFTERFSDYGESHPQVVAMHYASAGDNERAVPLYIAAGKAALANSAYEEAVNQLRAGLDLIPGVQQNRGRDILELDLQASLGRAMTATRGYAAQEVEQRWLRACQLGEELGEIGTQVGVMMGLWQGQISQGRMLEALEQTKKLLLLAEQIGQPAPLYATRTAAGINRFHLGELARSEAYFEQVCSGYDMEKNRGLALTFGQDPCVSSLAWYAVSRWLRGYPADARVRIEMSVGLARRLEHPFTLAYALRRSLPVLYYARDTDDFAATLAELQALAKANSFAEVQAQAAFWQLIAEAEQSGRRKALLLASDIIGRYEQAGAVLNLCYGLGLLAEQYLRAEDFSAGLRHVETALATAEQTGEMWCAADLHRLHGELTLALDPADTAAAKAAYLRSLECGRDQGARFFELRARLGLARLYRNEGGIEQAREVLAPAAGLISDGDLPDLPDLPELAELAELQRELRAR